VLLFEAAVAKAQDAMRSAWERSQARYDSAEATAKAEFLKTRKGSKRAKRKAESAQQKDWNIYKADEKEAKAVYDTALTAARATADRAFDASSAKLYAAWKAFD
jgi:hypothetical protein